MPTGVILSSASVGAKQEDIEKVLSSHGLEVDKPEEEKTVVPEVPVEPKRDDFETEEAFEAAHVDWQDKQPKEEEEEEPEEKPAKPSRMKRKIDRATAELRSEIADLRKKLEAKEKSEEKPPEEKNPRPIRANFKSNEEYEDALLAWGTAKALSDKAMQDAKNSEQRQLEENLANYRSQVEEMKDEHDDWDEVVNQDIPMHQGVQLAIMEQENGAEVVYYLGRHPEYTHRLAEMTPLSAVMEVGRLSERLKAGASRSDAANSRETQKPKPRLPAPIKPVSTAATASTSLSSREAAEKRDFRAFRAAQRAGR